MNTNEAYPDFHAYSGLLMATQRYQLQGTTLYIFSITTPCTYVESSKHLVISLTSKIR